MWLIILFCLGIVYLYLYLRNYLKNSELDMEIDFCSNDIENNHDSYNHDYYVNSFQNLDFNEKINNIDFYNNSAKIPSNIRKRGRAGSPIKK